MSALSYFRNLLQHTYSTYNTITPTKFSSFRGNGDSVFAMGQVKGRVSTQAAPPPQKTARVNEINFPRKLLPPTHLCNTEQVGEKKQLSHEIPNPQGIAATPMQERQWSLHLLFAVYFSREKNNMDKRHFA